MVAKELACNGIESVRSIQITLFKPIRPMLAERASSIEEGLDRRRELLVQNTSWMGKEFKYTKARIITAVKLLMVQE